MANFKKLPCTKWERSGLLVRSAKAARSNAVARLKDRFETAESSRIGPGAATASSGFSVNLSTGRIPKPESGGWGQIAETGIGCVRGHAKHGDFVAT